MITLSNTIEEVENRLTRLVNEAIKYKFGINGEHRCIHPADIVTDPSAGIQTYFFRDEAAYNEGPWKDFVDSKVKGRLPKNKTPQTLFQDVDKAILDGDIIVMLVDISGQSIDWDDLRGWHYHPPGDKFDDDFDQPPPPASDDTDPRGRFCVCIYSSGGVF